MPSVPDHNTCGECNYAKSRNKKRDTGTTGIAMRCTLSGQPTAPTRAACTLAKPKAHRIQ